MTTVGSTCPTSASGPTVAAPSALPTSTNTVWATPMRDLGVHVRCSSVTTLQDALLGGRLHENLSVTTTAFNGASASGSNATVLTGASIYGGIISLNAVTGANYYQWDTASNILAAFPQARNNDFVHVYLQNVGTAYAQIGLNSAGNETYSYGTDTSITSIQVAPGTISHVFLELQNVYPIGTAVTSIVFYAATNNAPADLTPAMLSAGIEGGSTNGLAQQISVTSSSTNTLSADDLISQLVEIAVASGSTLSAGFNVATDTAANIITAIPNVQVNSRFSCRLLNNSTETATLTAGTGVTLVGTAAIESGDGVELIVVITDVASGSQAVTIYII
jgi:hypothetical protein